MEASLDKHIFLMEDEILSRKRKSRKKKYKFFNRYISAFAKIPLTLASGGA